MVMLLIAVLLAVIAVYLHQLKVQIAKLGLNPNFNVLTRTAALGQVQNRKGRGMAVVTFDVAGMGKMNQLHGEQWVNTAICAALNEVRGVLRSSDIVGQLNSGDEFFILCKHGDEGEVVRKVEKAFAGHWPGGVYMASAPVVTGVMDAITESMETVYSIKAVKKGLVVDVQPLVCYVCGKSGPDMVGSGINDMVHMDCLSLPYNWDAA